MGKWYILYNDVNELIYKTNSFELLNNYIKNFIYDFEEIYDENDKCIFFTNEWYLEIIN